MKKLVLLSIHPEHAFNIISGVKIFEYRRIIPKEDVSHMALYATSPTKRIVAVAEITGYITGSPTKVWNTTSFGAGITHKHYKEYFNGRKSAGAIVIGRVHELKKPLFLSHLSGVDIPPQSYCYLDDSDTKMVITNKKRIISQRQRMIFLGGVHGVGKGTVCERIFSPAGYHCVTASGLIAEQGRKTDENKRVSSVTDNQTVLIKALENKSKNHRRLLLDGHFTLINKKNEIEPINKDVFRSMKINQLLLVKGKVEEIVNRLMSRDDYKWDASFIERFQKEEEAHARYISKDMGIPLHIIKG